MDDLSEKLDRLLGSPDGMKRIEDMMAAFGGMAQTTSTPAPAPEPTPAQEPPAAAPFPALGAGLDMGQLLKLMPLIGQLQGDDDNTALLHALRPHLKDERQKRLDEAGQMLKLMKLMPLLKELSGKGGESDDN